MREWIEEVVSRVLGVALIALAAAFPGSGSAAQVYGELFLAAKRLSGYECPAGTMAADICNAIPIRIEPLPRGQLGRFMGTAPSFITVSPDLDPGSPLFRLVILHEYVHYLQWLAGKFVPATLTCHKLVEMEEEAHRVTGQYAAEIGVPLEYPAAMLERQRAACAP